MTTHEIASPTLTADVDGGVLVVTIDAPGEPLNTLSPALVDEFESVFAQVDADPLVRAVVLISGKPDSFIAGADIEQFAQFRVPADAERVSRLGQDLLNRLERLRAPFVAA